MFGSPSSKKTKEKINPKYRNTHLDSNKYGNG
jgi:hypothetical protein